MNKKLNSAEPIRVTLTVFNAKDSWENVIEVKWADKKKMAIPMPNKTVKYEKENILKIIYGKTNFSLPIK